VTVTHLYASQDAGLAVNPGAVENQMNGGMVQMASRTLFEELRIGKTNVLSLDWVSYPIMRFKDAPAITTVVVQRTDQPSTGSGEPASAPVAAAIANAFFDATGVRPRSLPLTPARVRALLAAAR
jgi:CO/xanthine dehydrogenase Mo-binding subunit